MINFLKGLFAKTEVDRSADCLDDEFRKIIKDAYALENPDQHPGEIMAILYVMAQYTHHSELYADFLSPEYLKELEHAVELEYGNIHKNVYSLFIHSKSGYFHSTTPGKVKELHDNLRK